MGRVTGLRVCVLASGLLVGGSAAAEPYFPDRIPNGRNPAVGAPRPCAICHEDAAGGGARNPFGRDFDERRDWSSLYDMDSDGDGLTNGAELGDPRGVWSLGRVPERTTGLSQPGDPNRTVGPEPDAGAIRDADAVDLGALDGTPSDALALDAGSVDAGGPERPADARPTSPGPSRTGCVCLTGAAGPGVWGLGLSLCALALRRRPHAQD